MAVYYNEYDPFAAAWLRELIAEGLVAPGEVDERSIEDVAPEELRGFVQCHFFAGIGVWSLALRLAGWEDNREIWTGSCPCQPFSGAGKGAGFADERHLWPAFEWLIAHAKPRNVPVIGEQVASADGLHWLDLVSADMEGQGYALGALDTCAAGFGSPHIRQRLYWCADGVAHPAGNGDAIGAGLEGWWQSSRGRVDQLVAGAASVVERVADAMPTGRPERGSGPRGGSLARLRAIGGLDDARRNRRGAGRGGHGADVGIVNASASAAVGLAYRSSERRAGQRGAAQARNAEHSSVCDGVPFHPLAYWRDADWLLCRDPDGPRFRPVEPGSFPLVDAGTILNRLAEVRGAGNAINLAQAQAFVEAVMECRP